MHWAPREAKLQKPDLSALPGPSVNIALPDPYGAATNYYLGDVIRRAIAQIEDQAGPQASAARRPLP